MSAAGSSAERVLAFSVAGQALALPAADVAEVVASPGITRVPQAPPALRGLANIRGKVTPILSLDVLMGAETAADAGQVIVLDRESPVGLAVERVSAMRAVGAGEAPVRLLDLEPLLSKALARARPRATSGRPATVGESAAERSDDLAFLQFRLADQIYALPLDQVREVRPAPAEVTAMPHAEAVMIGLAPLGGRLLALVSLRALLGLPAAERPAAGRVVVTALGEAVVGLLVDEVNAILRVRPADVGPVPGVLNRGAGEARIESIVRTPGGLVSVLAAEKVFREDTVAAIIAEGQETSAQVEAEEAHDGAIERFVLFRLGDETYGLPLDAVSEVVRMPEQVTRTPHAPAFVAGLMNHRGEVVPLIDQRGRFGVPGGAAEARQRRVIIAHLDALTAGFVVDGVERILEAPAHALRPAPEVASAEAPVFDRVATFEQDGRLVLLVNPRQLLDQAERDIVSALADRSSGVA